MKKIITILSICLVMTGCSQKKTIVKDNTSNGQDSSSVTITDNSSNSETTVIEDNSKNEETKSTTISLGETYTVGDVCEFTLNDVEWNDSVLPSNTSDYYSYFEDVDGETYLIVRGEAKNIAGDLLDVQWTSEAQVTINDKYNYDATLVMESTENNDFYGEAKPLQTLNLVVYSSISDEAKEMAESIVLKISFLNDSNDISGFYSESKSHEDFILKLK